MVSEVMAEADLDAVLSARSQQLASAEWLAGGG